MEEVEKKDGEMTDITELVFKNIENDPLSGFQVSLMTRGEAKKLVDETQIRILSQHVLKDTFKCKDETVQKFQEWMKTQARLFDGCIEFVYCPCSVGVVIWASNSLTNSTIELTKY